MLDIKFLRENPDIVKQNIKNKFQDRKLPLVDEVIELDPVSYTHLHAAGKPFADDVDFSVVAKTTSGFTGADLENLLNEAALLTARAGKKKIDMEEVQKAFVKVGIGTEKKSRIISEKEKLITAYHESGHAILFEVLEKCDPVHSVSIIPTGMAGGYTMPLPGEDKMYMTKGEMEDEIIKMCIRDRFANCRFARNVILKFPPLQLWLLKTMKKYREIRILLWNCPREGI